MRSNKLEIYSCLQYSGPPDLSCTCIFTQPILLLQIMVEPVEQWKNLAGENLIVSCVYNWLESLARVQSVVFLLYTKYMYMYMYAV